MGGNMAACFGPAKSRRSYVGRVFTSNLLLYVCSALDYNLFLALHMFFCQRKSVAAEGGGDLHDLR
jgi:hypothetical protein